MSTDQLTPAIGGRAPVIGPKDKITITTQKLSAIPIELRSQIKAEQLRANKNCKKGCHGTGVWGYNTVDTAPQQVLKTVEKEGKVFKVATGQIKRIPHVKSANQIHQPILCECVTVVSAEVQNAPVKS